MVNPLPTRRTSSLSHCETAGISCQELRNQSLQRIGDLILGPSKINDLVRIAPKGVTLDGGHVKAQVLQERLG
jgi:hypothetical protein